MSVLKLHVTLRNYILQKVKHLRYYNNPLINHEFQKRKRIKRPIENRLNQTIHKYKTLVDGLYLKLNISKEYVDAVVSIQFL